MNVIFLQYLRTLNLKSILYFKIYIYFFDYLTYFFYSLSVVRWKCTLCQDVKPYSRDINQKDFTGHIPFGHSERKLIERILMQLYCQNDDSEHYRDCLNREMVRYTIYICCNVLIYGKIILVIQN